MKKIYLLLLGLFALNLAKAQPPLNASDLNTSIGTQFKQYALTSDFAGSPGTDQVWDFTNLFAEDQQNVSTFEYGNTGSESNYPEANSVLSFEFDSFFQYYLINNEEFSFHGVSEEGGVDLTYSDPSVYCEFPLEMGETFVDSFAFQYTVQGTEGEATGSYDAEVDGNGVLQLPWGDLPMTYRVQGTTTQEEEFEVQGETVTGFYNGTFTSFFAPGYPAPVLQVRSGTLSVPALDFEQSQQATLFLGDFEFLGVDEAEIVENLNVFPNPSKGEFTISFDNSQNRDISLEVLDIQGRIVHAEGAIVRGFGAIRHTVNLNSLNPGFYLLRLSDGESFQGRKIQVVR